MQLLEAKHQNSHDIQAAKQKNSTCCFDQEINPFVSFLFFQSKNLLPHDSSPYMVGREGFEPSLNGF